MKTNKKKTTLKALRSNPLYTSALLKRGNGKLKDYEDIIKGVKYRYAQVNVRALVDCPFRSAGCEKVCYATKGNHQFTSVKESRERSYKETKRKDFAKAMTYTINVEKRSRRYAGAVMVVRIHESGDFYSIQYLRKWLKVWRSFLKNDGVVFVFYTKSFRFFNMLSKAEKKALRKLQRVGRVAMSASLDDTTTQAQIMEYLELQKNFPLTNTYYCTEDTEKVSHDNVCDCADCAKCGICNHATGKKTVVKIHSASGKDLEGYRENIRK